MQAPSQDPVTTFEQIASEEYHFDSVDSLAVDDDRATADCAEGGANTNRVPTFRHLLSSVLEPVLVTDSDVNVEECITILVRAMSSDLASNTDAIGLWTVRQAKSILDALQAWIDQTTLGHESPARRAVLYLLIKLSAASDELPPSLFIRGVDIGPERDPLRTGGCADIFKGSYREKIVAVKKLRLLEETKAKLHTKFRKEALIWRQLDHPFVLKFLGVDAETFASTDFLCMVSPWMELGTMLNFLKSDLYKPKPDGDRLLHEVAIGLVYLHSQKVVHGDVSWVNVFIDGDLHARIADFGLTNVGDLTTGCPTATSGANGSIRWMSPERIDARECTRRVPECDVYAFGCLCFALYTLRPPFHDKGTSGVIAEVTRGNRPPRPVKADCHGMELSDELWDLIGRCWKHEPTDRPRMQDVADFFEPSSDNSTTPP